MPAKPESYASYLRPPRQRSAKQSHLSEFLQDARGMFNVFTLISLWAGVTLVTAPLVCRLRGWAALTHEEISALVLVYCISALGDYLLSIFLNKLPSSLTLNTEGGDAGVALGSEATNNAPNAPKQETQP